MAEIPEREENWFSKQGKKAKDAFLDPFTCDPNDEKDSRKNFECTSKRIINGWFYAVAIILVIVGILIFVFYFANVAYDINGILLLFVFLPLLSLLPGALIGFLIMRKNQKNATIGAIVTPIVSIGIFILILVILQNF